MSNLIPAAPGTSLGSFKATDADGIERTVEVMFASTGHVVSVVDDVVQPLRADPMVAVSLAHRVLAGDTRAMSIEAMMQIAATLAGADLITDGGAAP